jgi:hypothetical protein
VFEVVLLNILLLEPVLGMEEVLKLLEVLLLSKWLLAEDISFTLFIILDASLVEGVLCIILLVGLATPELSKISLLEDTAFKTKLFGLDPCNILFEVLFIIFGASFGEGVLCIIVGLALALAATMLFVLPFIVFVFMIL